MKFASLFCIVSLLAAPAYADTVQSKIKPGAPGGAKAPKGDAKPKTGSGNASAKGSAKPAAGVNILEGDFLTGFETGIFLRKDKKQLDEYGCPKAEIKMEEFKKIRDLLPNVKNIIKVMSPQAVDNEMDNMLDSLVVFVNHLDELIGVFDNDYNGGDFCAGMTFGASGSNLLFSIAETIVSHAIKSVKKPQHAQKPKTGGEDPVIMQGH